MLPIVSIIVPVYNAQSSIKRCVDSILAQTENNFEVILVDDGSKDNSLEICMGFSTLDKRVTVIHQNNLGVSAARNAGIDASIAKWLTFVDSDDYIDCSYIEDLLAGQRENDADFVIAGYTIVNEITWKETQRKAAKAQMKIEQLVKDMDAWDGFFNGPVAKLYRSSIICENKIRFPLNIHIGEDKIFCSEYLKYCKLLSFVASVEYHYIIGKVGTLSSQQNMLIPEFNFRSAELRSELRKKVGENCGDIEYQKQFYNTLIFNYMRVFNKRMSYGFREKLQYCNLMCNDETVRQLLTKYSGYNKKTRLIHFLMKERWIKPLYLLWFIRGMKDR